MNTTELNTEVARILEWTCLENDDDSDCGSGVIGRAPWFRPDDSFAEVPNYAESLDAIRRDLLRKLSADEWESFMDELLQWTEVKPAHSHSAYSAMRRAFDASPEAVCRAWVLAKHSDPEAICRAWLK